MELLQALSSAEEPVFCDVSERQKSREASNKGDLLPNKSAEA